LNALIEESNIARKVIHTLLLNAQIRSQDYLNRMSSTGGEINSMIQK